MTGERVVIYSKPDGFIARKNVISEEVITKGEYSFTGNLNIANSFPYGSYPWVATVNSVPASGHDTGFVIVGFGRLWKYVTLPASFDWGETVWLDDKGNIWASPHHGKIAIIPWFIWGRNNDFLVRNVSCDGYFVLGNDKVFTRNGKTLHAYDKESFESIWDIELDCTPREVYWKESVNGLVTPSEDGHCVMLIDGDTGEIKASQDLGGPVYDVTVDKWDNYRVLQDDYIKILYETDLKDLGYEIRICNGGKSIAANSRRDLAIETGINHPLIYLAQFDYERRIGDTFKSSESYLTAIGDQGAYLVNPLSTLNFKIYETRTDSYYLDYEVNTSFIYRKFIINTKGDAGLVQHLIWGRNWKPAVESILIFLFGKIPKFENPQMVNVVHTRGRVFALKTPVAHRFTHDVSCDIKLDMTKSIKNCPYVKRVDTKAFIKTSEDSREIEFISPETYLGDHVYVDSAGNIWTLDVESRQLRFFLPEADYSAFTFTPSPVTDTYTSVFTASDNYVFVAGDNKVLVYSRNGLILTYLGIVDVTTPHEMYWDDQNQCLFVRSPYQISIVGLNETNKPVLHDSLSIEEGTFDVAIDKYRRYWLLIPDNKIKIYELTNEKKLRLVEEKPAVSVDSAREDTARYICENSNYDILVAVNVQDVEHPHPEEGGASVYIWTALSDYSNVLRASLGREFFKGVVPLGEEGWLLYRTNSFTLFDMNSQEHHKVSGGSVTWGDPGLGRHLTWGTMTSNKDPLLDFLEEE